MECKGDSMMTGGNLQPKIQPEIVKLGGLQSHNVRIHNRRTSVRLEHEMWQALNDIAGAERCSVHDLCGAVHDQKEAGASFTAALRVFIMEYYRTATRTSVQVSMVQKRLRGERPEPQKVSA